MSCFADLGCGCEGGGKVYRDMPVFRSSGDHDCIVMCLAVRFILDHWAGTAVAEVLCSDVISYGSFGTLL